MRAEVLGALDVDERSVATFGWSVDAIAAVAGTDVTSTTPIARASRRPVRAMSERLTTLVPCRTRIASEQPGYLRLMIETHSGRLSGRVALVTGGADGIGAGVVRRLHDEGAAVALVDVDEVRGSEIVRSLGDRSVFVRADVTDESDVVAMVRGTEAALGEVDVLVNNAWGGGGMGRVERKTNELLRHGLDMSYFAAFWAMRECFPAMKRRGWGRVINMCSLNGVNSHMGTLEYNVGKEALRTLTRTAAREWAATGVVVNAVCPAAKSAAFRRVMGRHPELEAAADAGNPMGRIGDPYDDVAPVVAFLASDDCRYLTGNTLFVDGGSHINGSPWAPDLGD